MSRSLLRGGLGVGAATAVASACNYATNVALGRGLGADAFGDAAVVVSSLLLLSALATGVQLGVARIIVNGRAERLGAMRRATLTAGLVGGAALVAGSSLLARLFHLASALPLALLGAGLPVYAALSLRRGALHGAGSFGRLAVTLVAEAVARLVITGALMVAGLGPSAAAAGLSGSFVLAWWTGRTPRTKVLSTRRPDRGAPVGGAAKGAFGLLLASQVLIANGDVLVVNARLAQQAGTYAAIAMIGRVVFVAAWAVVTVVFPSLAERVDAATRRRLFRRALGATVLIGAAMTAGAALLARPLIGLLLGSGYSDGAPLLWPYALATTLFAVANLFAVADAAVGAVVAPALLLTGGVAQTALLMATVPKGMGWAVWVQVAAMAGTVVAIVVARALSRVGLPRLRLVRGTARSDRTRGARWSMIDGRYWWTCSSWRPRTQADRVWAMRQPR